MTHRSVWESLIDFLDSHKHITFTLAAMAISISILFGWNFYDIMWWLEWYDIAKSHGILDIYILCTIPSCKIPYPPLAPLLFIASYGLATPLPLGLRMLIVKLLLVLLPGILIFIILYRIKGSKAAILWIFSFPFLQLLIALQFDVLVALFLILAVILLWKDRYYLSAVSLALATLIKHALIVLLPIGLYIAYRRKNLRASFLYLILFMFTISAISIPFMLQDPTSFLNNVLYFHSHRIPQDLSLWAIPTVLFERSIVSLNILQWCWTLFYAIVYLALFIVFRRINIWKSLEGISIAMTMTLLAFITMSKIGNFNYLVWIVPIGILGLYGISRTKAVFFVALLSAAILFGWAPYIALLYLPPAVLGKPVFIPEDLALWNARYLFSHFINQNLFNILTKLGLISSAYTPLELFEKASNIFVRIYELRKPLILLTLFIGQGFLTYTLIELTKILQKL